MTLVGQKVQPVPENGVAKPVARGRAKKRERNSSIFFIKDFLVTRTTPKSGGHFVEKESSKYSNTQKQKNHGEVIPKKFHYPREK